MFNDVLNTRYVLVSHHSAITNNLPHNVKDLAKETKLFRNASKRFLLSNSFYNSEEYFNYQR